MSDFPKPLDGEEIKVAIAHKMTQALLESMDRDCAFFGKAYPKFKASWTIHYELDNFGLTREGNIRGSSPVNQFNEFSGIYEGTDLRLDDPVSHEVQGEISETPPDVLRKETSQPVPVPVVDERGLQTEKAIIYKQRKPLVRRG